MRGLVTIESGPTESTFTPALRRALRFAPWIKLFGGVRLLQRKVRSLLLDSSGDATWVTDDVIARYTAGASQNLDATLEAYLAMAGAREPERLAPHLAEIDCQVRLLIGTVRHDGGVTADEVRLLERALPAFALGSALGAGHFVQEEQPYAVVTAVRELRLTASLARP